MSTAKSIEVLGPGCARCKETYRVILETVEQEGLECEVTKNESITRMVELGLMSTPGVAVDGRIVLAGRVPRAGEVRQLLRIG